MPKSQKVRSNHGTIRKGTQAKPKRWETHHELTINQDKKLILKTEYKRSSIINFLAEHLLLFQFVPASDSITGKIASAMPKISGLEGPHDMKHWGLGSLTIEGTLEHYSEGSVLKEKLNYIVSDTRLYGIPDDWKQIIKERSDNPTLPQMFSQQDEGLRSKSEIPAAHWLALVKEKRLIGDDEWAQLNAIASTAEEYVRTHLARRLYSAMISLLFESLFEASGLAVPPDTIRSLDTYIKSFVSRRLLTRGRGRTKGSGLFKTVEDFRAALQNVFEGFSQKPSEIEVIEHLRQHALCQRRTSKAALQSQTRTLRGWIKKSGFNDFHDAWRRHLLSRGKRKTIRTQLFSSKSGK